MNADPCACSFDAFGDMLGQRFGIRKKTKALRPGQILDAALEEFCQHGFAATRLEDIAKRAGISKALIYVYYPTKIDLFLAVAQRVSEALKGHKGPFIVDKTRSAEAQMQEEHESFYTHLLHDDTTLRFFRLMIAESGRVPEIAKFYTLDLIGAEKQALHTLIRHGIDRGEFPLDAAQRLEGIEDIVLSPAVMLMLSQIVTSRTDTYDLKKWQTAHWSMIMSLLKAPSA